MAEIPLSPAQQDVFDALRTDGDRRAFDPALGAQLRALLEEDLAPLADDIGDDRLVLTKHRLSAVHGCQVRYVAEEAERFRWTVPTARGAVAHKAIELGVHWRGAEATPLGLVDEALERLAQSDTSFSTWLQTLPPAERAELRAEANDKVAKFGECFPPLAARYRPVTEARYSAELLGDRVVLVGKVDLTLGRPRGSLAGKVIIDLKTGGFAPNHLDDLRFYALIETLRLGVPPLRLATYYLDSGRMQVEVVTESLLEAARRRAVEGAALALALRDGAREPAARPGPACGWCTVRVGCEPGAAWLASRRPDP